MNNPNGNGAPVPPGNVARKNVSNKVVNTPVSPSPDSMPPGPPILIRQNARYGPLPTTSEAPSGTHTGGRKRTHKKREKYGVKPILKSVEGIIIK
jgi:hypothetical protein